MSHNRLTLANLGLPRHYVHVEDVALVHVAALLDASVDHQRLFAWSDAFTWNDVLAILRKAQPGESFIDYLPAQTMMKATVDDKLAKALVKKWGNGQQGFWGLEKGIRDTMSGKMPVFGVAVAIEQIPKGGIEGFAQSATA